MSKHTMRLLSLALVFMLALTLLPSAAFAANSAPVQVVPFIYDGARSFSNGLASVFIGENWFEGGRGNQGYIDKTGNVVVPLQYDTADDFSEGLAMVGLDGKKGYIDTEGNEVIPRIYDIARGFSEGLAWVDLDGKSGYIDTEGNVVIPFAEYGYAGDFFEGLAIVQPESDGPRGYMDKNGKIVITPQYEHAYAFSEGLACVSVLTDGAYKFGYIDKTGEVIIPFIYDHADSFSEGLAEVGIDGGYGYIDKTGKTVIPLELMEANPFSEGLAAVRVWVKIDEHTSTMSQYGYIDKTGKTVIPFEYFSAQPFSEGLALVRVHFGENCGYIDKTGRTVVPFVYDWTSESFAEGYAAVTNGDGKSGYISIPELSSSPAHAIDSASVWARGDISSAVEKGFVPVDLQDNYTNTITRAEFCRLAVQWVEYVTHKDIDTVLSEKGLTRDQGAFGDTTDSDILAAFALGITNGTSAPSAAGPGRFTPDGQFSREQASVMIMNTCGAIGADISNPPSRYDLADIESASDWAVNGIHFVYANKIMQGTGQSNFSPKTLYTREQAIVTLWNIVPWLLPLPAPSVPQSSEASAIEWEVFERVNSLREFYDIKPLMRHEELADVARAHSIDMRQRNFEAHTNPDGLSEQDRVDNAGIYYEYGGENIASGQETATEVVNDWMNSPGHRQNILDERYTHIGVGFHDYYWTQDFIEQ